MNTGFLLKINKKKEIESHNKIKNNKIKNYYI